MRPLHSADPHTSGGIFITANAVQRLTTEDLALVLRRHLRANGDPGEVREAARANGRSAAESCRKLYAYRGVTGVQFWLISEADLSMAVLLPEDYGSCKPYWAASSAHLGCMTAK